MVRIAKYLKDNREIVGYLLFGVLTTIVNILVFTVCVDLFQMQYLLSNIFAWIASVLFAYITNRKYVFNSTSSKVGIELVKFFSSRLTTLALDMAVMWLLVDILTTGNLFAKIVANIFVIVGNYILSKLFVFNEARKS